MLLGEGEIRKFGSLLALAGMGSGKTEELTTQAAVRARFCEYAAKEMRIPGSDQEFFLGGMLSLIDAVVDQPMEDILSTLPVTKEIKSTLLGTPTALRDVLDCVVACERGEWDRLQNLARRLGLDEADAARLYVKAMEVVQTGPDAAILAA